MASYYETHKPTGVHPDTRTQGERDAVYAAAEAALDAKFVGPDPEAPQKPIVGDVIEAQWVIGPAQSGSGWLQAQHITDPKQYTVVDAFEHGYYYVQQSPDSGRIGIYDGQYRFPEGGAQ